MLLGGATACPSAPPPSPLTQGIALDDHEAYFPIGEGAKHVLGTGVITCGGCHDGGESFEDFFCFSCHDRPAGSLATKHGLVSAFRPAEAACLACHPDGQRGTQIGAGGDGGGADHPLFPTTPGAPHSSEEDPGNDDDYMDRVARQPDGHTTHCSACHGQTSDPLPTRCADCHAADTDPTVDDAHAGSPLQLAVGAVADCKGCHWTTPLPDMMRRADHDAVSCCTDHHNVDSCFDCHEQQAQDGDMAWAFDLAMPDGEVICSRCHAAARPVPDPCP
ncbi:MAG: hypothetical protein A2138_18805 [Deltaproteobacteria bacterium RBG_16_71_12]|nr:MAG: hypothetical protein A2138_18805 [Deltaproteobacteria bacterium RBG_16_71_12]